MKLLRHLPASSSSSFFSFHGHLAIPSFNSSSLCTSHSSYISPLSLPPPCPSSRFSRSPHCRSLCDFSVPANHHDASTHDDALPEDASIHDSYIIPTLSVTIKCTGDIADQLVEALMSFGASSVTVEDDATTSVCQEQASSGPEAWDERRQFWDQSKLTALFPPGQDLEENLGLAFESIGLEEMLPYEIESVKYEDWEQQIKDSFQPLNIADDFWIVPKWSIIPDNTAINVIMDPGLAFGTGDHPTTQLCLRWLKQAVKGRETVLDYGTGSGILAISALKLGAAHAAGVDIDPVAVASAKHNASLNGFESESFEVFLAATKKNDKIPTTEETYDIVIANILLNPLLQLSDTLLGYTKSGGYLCLSGILESQVDQVQGVYGPHLENIELHTQDGWACIHGEKRGVHV